MGLIDLPKFIPYTKTPQYLFLHFFSFFFFKYRFRLRHRYSRWIQRKRTTDVFQPLTTWLIWDPRLRDIRWRSSTTPPSIIVSARITRWSNSTLPNAGGAQS